jgi:hypothetical protein
MLGCWLHERWKTELAMCPFGAIDWLDLCNRHEVLSHDKNSGGRICEWRDSSQLTVSRVFPDVGRRLLMACLRHWPVALNFDEPVAYSKHPEASVLVAVGGTDRIRQFRTVLASLRAQSHSSMEIIVVEHSDTPELNNDLPRDIRYVHIPKTPEDGFNKSKALNVAAGHAHGRCLLIHDADYVVPRDYVSECCRVLKNVHGVRPSRFNFHLDERSTFEFTEARELPCRPCPEFVVQNNPTPMALRAESYWEIGGHDESFIGWGGEDVEFLSRLRTLSVCEGGWLPTIHLWHPPAPRKASGHRNQRQQDELLATDPQVRIERLRSCQRRE